MIQLSVGAGTLQPLKGDKRRHTSITAQSVVIHHYAERVALTYCKYTCREKTGGCTPCAKAIGIRRWGNVRDMTENSKVICEDRRGFCDQ